MSKTFEEKLEDASNSILANEDDHYEWARWAYCEGIKAAIEMLRKEEAKEIYVSHSGDFTNNNWAEWLEEHFREELKK